MGSVIGKLFVDVESLPHDGYGMVQCLFLGLVYGYILCISSGWIKDGSELLLLVPSLSGVIGSIVLPVLGVVPDGAMVLFSGLGDNPQEEVAVGIGALAGSTIMLLTIPWCLSLIGGRVNLDADGNGNYVKPKNAPAGWAKLTPGKWAGTGINVGPAIKYTAKIMLLTLTTFFIIQIPAFFSDCIKDGDDEDCHQPRASAIVGAILAALLFCFYLWDQARIAAEGSAPPIVAEKTLDETRKHAIKAGFVSLRGLFPSQLSDAEGTLLIRADDRRFQQFLRPYFRRFDADNSGKVDRNELGLILASLGEKLSRAELDFVMDEMDTNRSGDIDFDEFVGAMAKILAKEPEIRGRRNTNPRADDIQDNKAKEGEDDEEEEEVEMPEDLADLSPEEQQRKLLIRSFVTMIGGVLVVLLFSDPMVDVMAEVGHRLHISPFFVAFCLAPIASNASELIASYAYAMKKTERTITLSMATLLGAACMNNTFCLSIFLFLVYFRKLQWTFTAETLSIAIIELLMFIFANLRVHRLWYGFVVVLLFPVAILLVVGLEAMGLNQGRRMSNQQYGCTTQRNTKNPS